MSIPTEAHSRARQQDIARNHPPGMSQSALYSGAYLDAHFSVFGSNSGFDHIEECFEDLSDHIYALENRPVFRPAHELAAVNARPVRSGVEFRRTFSGQSWRAKPIYSILSYLMSQSTRR